MLFPPLTDLQISLRYVKTVTGIIAMKLTTSQINNRF